jgi:glycosyltransferase involved in cell wall biosynthesis
MSTPLEVLALEPWLGGSHLAFLQAWQGHSRHRLEFRGLDARHWKWRMRSAAWELARELPEIPGAEVLVTSDYLDLATFRGLAPVAWRELPTLVYFHENQLTYPSAPGAAQAERDHHFGFTNILTCLAADELAFNTRFHLEEFRHAALELLARLPRPTPARELEEKLERAHVISPGVELDSLALGAGGSGDVLRVGFNHRWEHDKDPLTFLRAARRAVRAGARLELVLLGERYGELPAGCAEELRALEGSVHHQGFAESATEYGRLLGECDVAVSTARHEFFGISAVEALAVGATPLFPHRLSYPELLGPVGSSASLYSDEDQLMSRLIELARDPGACRLSAERARWRAVAERWSAQHAARELDQVCSVLVATKD